jgi:energy-coupling factor transporter ATP-binding protein EcfA2
MPDLTAGPETRTTLDRAAASHLIESWRDVPGRGIVVIAGDMKEWELHSDREAELFCGALSGAVCALRDGKAVSEDIRARMEAAEQVCALYGWTGGVHDSDHAKALHELWAEWVALVGDDGASPLSWPGLSDERIAELARRRDGKRGDALRRLRDLAGQSGYEVPGA